MNIGPTEYDMLIDDERTLLQEMEEDKSNLIRLEAELGIVRHKMAFIKSAVPENAAYSNDQ